jgi:hypothetical protein
MMPHSLSLAATCCAPARWGYSPYPLTLIGIEPSLGRGPQNLAITRNGKLLLCVNMPGNNVAVFRISESGGLKSAGKPVPVTSPSCIQSPSPSTSGTIPGDEPPATG